MDERYNSVKDCSHQLQQHLKNVISKQREQQIMDNAIVDERELISYKNKAKGKESAVASTVVKMHLQRFVIGRQKSKNMESYPSASLMDSSQWPAKNKPYVNEGDVCGSSTSINKKYNFPLRKTASEPNLKVRSRLRQMLSQDQRNSNSPIMARRNHASRLIKKQVTESSTPSTNDTESNTGSNPNSPPPHGVDGHPSLLLQRTESGKLPINGLKELPESSSQADLYSSPSLPNLPLGLHRRPPFNRDLTPESLLAQGLNFSDPKLNAAFHPDLIKAPGPIRNKNYQNRHSRLGRTHSAPGGQTLQQHMLSKQMKLLRSKLMDPGAYSAYQDAHNILPSGHPNTTTANVVVQPHLKPFYNPIGIPWANFSLNQSLPYPSFLYQHIPALHGIQSLDQNQLYSIGSTSESAVSSTSDLTKTNQPSSSSTTDLRDTVEKSSSAVQRKKSTVLPPVEANNVETTEILSDDEEEPAALQNKSVEQIHKPLSRTKSSPLPTFMPRANCRKYRYTTGIAYSPVMLQHGCSCEDDHAHIENSGRLKAIFNYLKARNLVDDNADERCNANVRCEMITPRKATTEELQLVHTQEHTFRYGTTSLARKQFKMESKFVVLPCGGIGVDNGIDIDTVWNEQETVNAARMAVGCTIDLAIEVAIGNLRNGFSIVRPPGHHAEENLAMAFCYFNNVAIAAKKLLNRGLAKKILILDWDAHHCNGTQKIFYENPAIMVISVHRYDNGKFFPGTGSKEEVGSGSGESYNVNVTLDGGVEPPMGDQEYLAVFRSIVMPIAQQYNPDFVFISCGFAAAKGHPASLAGYAVTPQCFGYLTYMLSNLAKGKLVMVLEGGFEIKSLCECTEACIETLLDSKKFSTISNTALNSKPLPVAVNSIKAVMEVQSRYWRNLDYRLGDMSHMEYLRASHEKETCEAMAQLSVKGQKISNLTSHITNNEPIKSCSSKNESGSAMNADIEISDEGEQNTDVEVEL